MRVSSLMKRLGLKLSLNDPRWGNKDDNKHAQEGKKPDGPPDLDQIWRDFNQRLNNFFGQKNRSGGDGGGNGPGHNAKGNGQIGLQSLSCTRNEVRIH